MIFTNRSRKKLSRYYLLGFLYFNPMITSRTEGRGKKKVTHYHRTYNYIVRHEEFAKKPVLYIIWFGEYFYIGMAKHYFNRKSAHIGSIKTYCASPGKNYAAENTSYYLIAEYMNKNLDIEDIVFEVIEDFDEYDEDLLKMCETEWFTYIKYNGLWDFCLNYAEVHRDEYQTAREYEPKTNCFYGLYCL